MTIDRLRNLAESKQQFIPFVLLVIAALSGVAALAKITGYFMASARAVNIVDQAIAKSESDPNVVEAQIAKVKPIAEDLKKNNLFSPPLPKQHPVRDVLGIFGDEVWINGKWYKAGDSIADAKIVAIGPTSVTVEWDGNTKDFYPIQAKVAEAPKPGGRSAPGNKGTEGERSQGGPSQVSVQIQGGPPGPGRLGMRGDFMMRGRFGEMSQQERERFFREMRERRERMGGGRGGFSGPRGRGGGRR
jgi:hypothetical protein